MFACSDGGWITLAVISEDHFWQAVCVGLDLAVDLRDLRHLDRLDRFDECQAAVAAACARLTRGEALARLTDAGAPVAPVLDPSEMAANEQFREREVVFDAGDGTARLGFPARLQEHPPRTPGPTPEVGQDLHERVIMAEQRSLEFLKSVVRKIWKVIVGAEQFALEMFPQLKDPRYPSLPQDLIFLHAEEILELYPDLPRKQRETAVLQKYPAIFIIGIGWPLKDGYPHEMRAADYDDWVTDTSQETGAATHGLNGDILVWNPVTRRRHELTSMGIRVTKDTLKQQLEMSKQLDFMRLPYHRAILEDQIPLSIGGGIGQSRTLMLLLRKAHLGEVSVTVWPKILKEICAKKDIFVLE